MKTQALNTVLRDIGSTVAGLSILYHQTFLAKEPHGLLLLTAMVLLGVPGATGLLSLWLNGRGSGGGTLESSSQSRLSTSSRQSSSPSGGKDDS